MTVTEVRDGALRVLVADDQALVRTGFRMILTAEGIDVVAEAADGVQAVDAVRRTRPDVVLMDVRMPELDGLEATRRILTGAPGEPRVIMLTTFDLDRYVYAALSAGASGFLLKDVTPEHLAAAVRLVRSGDALLAPSITRRLVERYARPDPAPGLVHRQLAVLTPRERRCSDCWPRASATANSPDNCTCPGRPSRPMSPASSPSSASVTGSRRSWSRTRRAWSPRAAG
ncbi:hypothetical protein GCM10027605_61820 [Micromonospora zhanjiangensis]